MGDKNSSVDNPASLANVLLRRQTDEQRRKKNQEKRKGRFVTDEGEECTIKTPPFTVINTMAPYELMGKGAPVVGVSGTRTLNPEDAVIVKQK